MRDRIFYGQRLWLARNIRGYSFEDVGELVAASRQYIQQIESKEEKQPSEEMVFALSDIFEVTPDFFFKPMSKAISSDQCHFRKLQATPVSMKNQALAHGTLFEELVNELEHMLELPEVNFPQIQPRDLSDIDRVAEQCRIHWQLGTTAPITNMIRVVENAGAFVAFFDGISDKVDAFSMHADRPLIIRNKAKQSVCRTRFDVAHECGHLVMHAGVHTGDKKTEDEANRFASAFLLPRAAFIKEFPTGKRLSWQKIYELKLRWKVSVGAIIRRAYDLGIMNAAQYRTANVHLRKTGEAKNERYDDRDDLIPPETPEIVHNAIALLEEHAPERIPFLFESLGVKQPFLEQLIDKKLQAKAAAPKKSENNGLSAKIIKFDDYRKS